jgi:sigma-B regulation protein RsbU (phosphoserine phosphatase)
MTISPPSPTRGFRSISTRLIVWILGTVGILYLSSILYIHFLSRDMVVDGAEKEAANATLAAVNDIEGVLTSVEEGTKTLATVLAAAKPGDALPKVLADFVAGDPRIYGSAGALAPEFAPEPLAPYAYRAEDGVLITDLALDEDYRYWEQDWYRDAVARGEPTWSEPYFDEGGGETYMVTYAVPVYVDGHTLAGVVTADLTLDWLNERMKSIRIGVTGYGILLSREGQIMAHPDKAVFESHQNALELVEAGGREDVITIVKSMLAGESDFVPFQDVILNKSVLLSYGPVGHAGWSLAVAYPEDELFADVVRLFQRQLLLLVVGLVVLVGLVLFLSKQITRPITALAGSARKLASGDLQLELPEVRTRDEIGTLTAAFHEMRGDLKTYIHDLEVTTRAKQKLESELQIAHEIQMAMLPKPPKGDDERYELSARLEPARAVGGDLYDHFVHDGKLFFLVADVSGKGVPAALFMARTKTLFGAITSREGDLSAVLTEVNASLLAENDAGMFVTAICGILDLDTGACILGNAGHDAPLLVPGSGEPPGFIEVDGGPVLGILNVTAYGTSSITFQAGDLLVMSTDGVSEALDEAGNFYTSERLEKELVRFGKKSAKEVTYDVFDSVRRFAGAADQSDDITVMSLRYRPSRRA